MNMQIKVEIFKISPRITQEYLLSQVLFKCLRYMF